MQNKFSIFLNKLKISIFFILIAVFLAALVSCDFKTDSGNNNLISVNKDDNGVYIRTTWVDKITNTQNGKDELSVLLNQLTNDKITRVYLRLGDIIPSENNDSFEFFNEDSYFTLTQDSISWFSRS